MDSLEQPQIRRMDISKEAHLLITAAREITKYSLDLVGVQAVRWDRSGTKQAGDYTFFCGNKNENHE
jgi:hypothetical protein